MNQYNHLPHIERQYRLVQRLIDDKCAQVMDLFPIPGGYLDQEMMNKLASDIQELRDMKETLENQLTVGV